MKADIERLAAAFMHGAEPQARATFDPAYAPLNVFAGVRPILQALREPSEETCFAGEYHEGRGDWQAMIDYLLSEDP